MHADWPQAAMVAPGPYRKLSAAALPWHRRSICVHPRHLLLICVESCLLWRVTHGGGARHRAPRAQARWRPAMRRHPLLRPMPAL